MLHRYVVCVDVAVIRVAVAVDVGDDVSVTCMVEDAVEDRVEDADVETLDDRDADAVVDTVLVPLVRWDADAVDKAVLDCVVVCGVCGRQHTDAAQKKDERRQRKNNPATRQHCVESCATLILID